MPIRGSPLVARRGWRRTDSPAHLSHAHGDRSRRAFQAFSAADFGWRLRFLAVFSGMARALINTPLQRGGGRVAGHFNRFSGFSMRGARLQHRWETAKAVKVPRQPAFTPLKRGVNERGPWAQSTSIPPKTARNRGRPRNMLSLLHFCCRPPPLPRKHSANPHR